ncbi:MAG TPA: DUF6152 family protein [Vicinamibacterales bacterium]|nr:DUF6152 family protein [Vicinamibacterales bacterium]
MKKLTVIVAAVWALLVAGSALAHHSPVMFDRAKKQTITGTVKEFSWVNPHASIQLEVQNAQGGVDVWGVEMNSPNNLVKQGWKSNILKGGDKVSIVINPLRTGEHGGAFVSIKLPDGKVLGDKWTEDIESKGVVGK